MDTASPHDRVKSFYQMLFEMATGNFSFRLHSSGQDDQLDELGRVLNRVAQAMQQSILEAGYLNPHYNYQSLVQTTFVLNSDFRIGSLSASVSAVLGYRPEMLFKEPFQNLLSIQSNSLWQQLEKEIKDDPQYHNTVQLIFITPAGKVLPAFCTLSRLLYSDKIFISSVATILQHGLADSFSVAPRGHQTSANTNLIQDVHDYILNHLEEPLPTVKELSKLFGTNEFRIKDGFRQFFNTSVYQFYNEERLKKAHLLIQQSDTPLKTIAFSCGYNDYINFYKAFKKRFGYTPSDLKREA